MTRFAVYKAQFEIKRRDFEMHPDTLWVTREPNYDGLNPDFMAEFVTSGEARDFKATLQDDVRDMGRFYLVTQHWIEEQYYDEELEEWIFIDFD